MQLGQGQGQREHKGQGEEQEKERGKEQEKGRGKEQEKERGKEREKGQGEEQETRSSPKRNRSPTESRGKGNESESETSRASDRESEERSPHQYQYEFWTFPNVECVSESLESESGGGAIFGCFGERQGDEDDEEPIAKSSSELAALTNAARFRAITSRLQDHTTPMLPYNSSSAF